MQKREKGSTGSFHLMQISLVRISLLQFFKAFQKYLAYAFLGLFISLMRFLYLANAIFWAKIAKKLH